MKRWPRVVATAALCPTLTACAALTSGLGPGASGGFHLAQLDRVPVATTSSSVRVERVPSTPQNATEWTLASVAPRSRTLLIGYFDSGSAECGLIDRADLEETTEVVVIGLHEVHTGTGACAASAVGHTLSVTLRRPLGVRAVMERATGVNDGLPVVTVPTTLPAPFCSASRGSASDVPVGMLDAAEHPAPAGAVRAYICRTWWPSGSVHTESTTISDPSAVAALASSLNSGSTDLRSGPPSPVPCPERVRGSWYDVTFQAPGLRVEVKTNEISCRTVTNGAVSGRLTPALEKTLDALFST